jgi:tRNA-2-methylthio-N6-dimethylallyladenosine synthase
MITDELIEVVKNEPKICRYFDMPIQHISDRVLKRMGRRYTAESYKELVDRLRATIPNVALSTDIIVGFPNETDEEFEDTLKMAEYCEYDSAFTFIYSPRVGTPAAKIKDEISDEVKHERFNRLLKIINESGIKKYKECVGKTLTVLVEGASKKDASTLTGYTETNKLVNFKGDIKHIGEFVKVKITNSHLFYLSGEEVND